MDSQLNVQQTHKLQVERLKAQRRKVNQKIDKDISAKEDIKRKINNTFDNLISKKSKVVDSPQEANQVLVVEEEGEVEWQTGPSIVEIKANQNEKIVLNTEIVSRLMGSIKTELRYYGGGIFETFHGGSPIFDEFVMAVCKDDVSNESYSGQIIEDRKITGYSELMIKCILHQLNSYLPKDRVLSIVRAAAAGMLHVENFDDDSELTKVLIRLYDLTSSLNKHLREYLFTTCNKQVFERYLEIENKIEKKSFFTNHIKDTAAVLREQIVDKDASEIIKCLRTIDKLKKSN